MCCSCCGVTQQKVWVFGFGALFTASGLLCILWWPGFIDETVLKSLPLKPDSRTFEMWETLPIPAYMYMYLWNWTNAEDAWTPGVKPHFEQLGPYVYREERKKMDLVWHANNTITFKMQRTWHWEAELSGGLQTDNITAPHIPSIAAAHSMRDSNRLLKLAFNSALNANGGHLYVTHTAAEWLFDSFYDEFLHYAMTLNNPLVPAIEDDHFAWFLHRNGSKEFEGDFTIHTGVGDINQLGEIQYWKGQNHTGWYEDECGKLNGSTSDLFVPGEPLEKPLTIYITDTCRILNLEFTGKSETIEGIEGWRYESTRNTFDNGQYNDDMKCYCPANRQPDNCPDSGATDLGPCGGGAPMYLSNERFMYADPSYTANITSLDPDPARDAFYIIIERKLGVPLKVNAAILISLLIEHDDDITILKGVQKFYAPLFTIASRAVMSKELASELKLALNLGSIGLYTGIGFLCLGCILIITGIVLTVKRKWYGQAAAEKEATVPSPE